ncbi:hypothetical protein KP79_PYT19405 [Mizuhopecten yessoensis]|uniref:Uncharacterized protein n=1 Tax=Mizuhopecten yessoensis TaxID=6573 RepID=A0A210PNZ1_MIZYE|nr:hypothetical protein KP79_PYT19405 [Mizuhopecten yessoensis]
MIKLKCLFVLLSMMVLISSDIVHSMPAHYIQQNVLAANDKLGGNLKRVRRADQGSQGFGNGSINPPTGR